MAVILYKKGDSTEVDGVKCDIVRCEVKDMARIIASGCVANVNDLVEKPKKKAKKVVDE